MFEPVGNNQATVERTAGPGENRRREGSGVAGGGYNLRRGDVATGGN